MDPVALAPVFSLLLPPVGAPEAISAPGGGGILTPGGSPPMEIPFREGSRMGAGTPVLAALGFTLALDEAEGKGG
jgi:hypothetical protein